MTALAATPVVAFGLQMRRDLADSKGLPRSVQYVGQELAWRFSRFPTRPLAGASSIARDVERRQGVTLSERTVRYALHVLRREGWVRPRCCGHGVCLGGRGHAAVLEPGDRQVGRAVGAFLLAVKGARVRLATRNLTIPRHPQKTKERPRARLFRRSDATAPFPRPRATAPPERFHDGSGPVRLSTLFPEL